MQDAIAAVFRRFARVASPRAYLRRRCSTVLGPGIVTKAASVTGSRFWLGAPGVLASDDVDLLRSVWECPSRSEMADMLGKWFLRASEVVEGMS